MPLGVVSEQSDISPIGKQRLDEPLRFAIGLGTIGSREDMADAQLD